MKIVMTVNSTTSGHWTTPSVWSSDSEPGALSGIFDISPLEFADGQITTITGELLINGRMPSLQMPQTRLATVP